MNYNHPTLSYVDALQKRYQLENADQVYSLIHVALGVGLQYIIDSIKNDTPSLQINRVVKDEVREVAGISISSLDKYIGEAFDSTRAIDSSTLEKISNNLFYDNQASNEPNFDATNFKYLKHQHIGILTKEPQNGGPERFINLMVNFIRAKPSLKQLINNNLSESKYPDLLGDIFQLNISAAKSTTSSLSLPLLAALLTFALGAALPLFVSFFSSADSLLVLDYLTHDPGKHFFHLIILPCIVWAALRCASIEQLLNHKILFFLLMVGGFAFSLVQTYVQHSQSICDLVTADYTCHDVVDRLFEDKIFDDIFFIYISFLSLVASLVSITIFICQLLELRNNGEKICSPLMYSVFNVSFIIWLIARSYSEWHEVALSFEMPNYNDFSMYHYQSFLSVLTFLIMSQILILLQIGQKKSTFIFASVFLIIDTISFFLVTNIQFIAPKFHSFNHFEFNKLNDLYMITGPLTYLSLISIITIYTYTILVNRVTADQNREPYN